MKSGQNRAVSEGKLRSRFFGKIGKVQLQADRMAEEVRIAELEKRCRENGLDFEEENSKYFEKQEQKKNSLIGKFLGTFLGL